MKYCIYMYLLLLILMLTRCASMTVEEQNKLWFNSCFEEFISKGVGPNIAGPACVRILEFEL